MKVRELNTTGAETGKRLNVALKDAHGEVLLEKGQVLEKSKVLDTIQRLKEEAEEAERLKELRDKELAAKAKAAAPKAEIEEARDNESPFEIIDRVLNQIESLYRLSDVSTQKYFVQRVSRVCELIHDVCSENEELALGSILMEQKARYTVRHPLRTAIVCHIISRHLGWKPDRQMSLIQAAVTMNIGMLSLQEQLNEQSEPLSAYQKGEVKNHPISGVELLKELGVTDQLWLDAVLQHHETLSGTGYPSGLKDDEISQGARILSLADIYCARVAGRSYRPPLLPSVAVKSIFMSNSTPVDKELAMVFVKNLGVFPPGTFVKLKNGEIGIVTQRGEKINSPIVYTLVKANGERAHAPLKRDTATSEDFAVKEVITQDKAGVEINKFQLWGYGIFKRAKTMMRKVDRVQTEIPAKLLDLETLSTADCIILNISENGCLLKTIAESKKELVVSKTYHLTFRIQSKTLENISATVRNSQERSGIKMMGMQFTEIKPEQQEVITAHLAKEAEKDA
jgi:HD-GYP domain-containing protein (c-di-GMP phosphodiesterase class II)